MNVQFGEHLNFAKISRGRDLIPRGKSRSCEKRLTNRFLRIYLSTELFFPLNSPALVPCVRSASFRNPTRAFRIFFCVTYYDRSARSKAEKERDKDRGEGREGGGGRERERERGKETRKGTKNARFVTHNVTAYPRDTSRTGIQLAVINQRCSDK